MSTDASNTTPGGGPYQERSAREMIGARLRQLRLERNKTLDDAAHAIDSHKAKVSRMERGQVPLRRRDLLDLLKLYGIDDPFQQETLISVATGMRPPNWWDDESVPLTETVLWSHEQAADLIRTYQPHLVPELLRTEEYAVAAHRIGHRPPPPAATTEIHVKNLMRRQQARRATLWAVIEEPVLWRPISGDIHMHIRQLDALAAANQAHGVTVQVNRMATPFLPVMEPFTLFSLGDKPQILALHRYAGDEIRALADSEQHGLLFEELGVVACLPSETPQILAHVREHVRNQPPSLS